MKSIITLLFLFVACSSQAQDTQFDRDTAAIETQLQKDFLNPGGLEEPASKATDAYDKLLNIYYKKLMSKLKPEDKKILIEAQRAWLAWSLKELEFIAVKNSPNYQGFSDIMVAQNTQEYFEIMKKRVIDIYTHLSNLSGE